MKKKEIRDFEETTQKAKKVRKHSSIFQSHYFRYNRVKNMHHSFE